MLRPSRSDLYGQGSGVEVGDHVASDGYGIRLAGGARALWRELAVRAAWLLVPVLCGACSVAIDANRAQCNTDADCTGRGGAFANSVCIASLCQPATSDDDTPDDTCEGGTSCSAQRADRDACVGTNCSPKGSRDAQSERGRDAQSPRDGQSPRDAAPEPDGVEQPADAPSRPRDAGAQEKPPEDEAKECSVDEDCKARGLMGATCIDSVCWLELDPKRCTYDQDCSALGPEFAGGRCVANSCRPNPRFRCEPPDPSSETGPLTLTALIRDSLSLDPLPNIRAVACQKLDLNCAEPVTEATTDAQGNLTLTVARDFAGYLQIEDRRFFPALYFLPQVLPSDGKLQPIPLLGLGVVDALALGIGSAIDRKRGHMMLISEDCLGTALSGVTFSSPQSDASTIQFYVQDLLPSVTAKETGPIGNGGYLNFPTGNAVIELTMPSTKLKLRTFSAVVRASFITVAYIRPELR